MSEPDKAVFLSYASQDAEAAQSICQALRAGGIEVWFDQSELRGGDSWDKKIRREIRECALFMPIISANTQARHEGYFRLEWRLADQRTHLMGKSRAFLVPVCIDETRDAGADVPDSFAEVQWTRLPRGQTPSALVGRVRDLLRPEQPRGTAEPEAVVGPQDAAPGPQSARLIRAGAVGTAALVLAAAGYFAVHHWWWQKSAQSQIPARSIAVLPFVDMSEKRDQEYFSDGLSEELIDHLAHSPDLKVIARTSSFQFKNKNEDVRTIAAKLGVANLLEGSVRTAGHAVRISAQLIRASDGTDLWSQVYDREMSDIFKIQEEIANTVVEALKATMSVGAGDSAAREQNLEAYNSLLKGDFFFERNHAGDLEHAKEEFGQALQLDPNYALAWARLARCYFKQAGTRELSQADGELKIRDALQHALSIDPNLAAAHHWMGRVFMNFDWNWSSAKSEYDRAIALDPNGPEGGLARKDLSGMDALITGRFDDWARGEVRVLAANPLDVHELWFAGWMLYNGGRMQEALSAQRRLLELDPAYSGMHGETARTLLLMGKSAEALAEAQKETDEESRLQELALVYWALGRRADSDMALSRVKSDFAQEHPYEIGEVYAYRGEADAANVWLERAYATRYGGMLLLKVDPLLVNLHNDARYKALLGKMKMPDAM
jgi:TolB-like protein